MNKLLKEEIERFQLLSKYDTTKTLDENYQSSEVISEAGANWLNKLFGREARTLSKTAAKELEVLFKSFPAEMKKFGNDAAEIIAKLQSNSYRPDELGTLRKTIFKNSSDDVVRKEIADDMVKSKNFKDFFSSVKEKKAIDDLIARGYSGDDAALLYKRYKNQNGKFLDDIKATVKPKTKPKTKGKTRQQSQSTNSNSFGGNRNQRITAASIAKSILNGAGVVVGFVYRNIWKLLALAATGWIAYEIWKILTKGGNTGYPDCLNKAVTPNDADKMRTRTHILLEKTGNEFIDENGGGNFYLDKKFETENKQHKGTWSYDEKSSEVVVKLDNGDEHTIVCENVPGWDDDEDEFPSDPISTTQTEKQKIISSWNGSYNECDEFPMSLGCKNEGIIGTVQICLGLPKDGKFSPKVLDALDSEGYGLELTFDNYKLIKGKCGMSSAKSGFASNL
jgi:hypothetical protein